jgi:hypothetical protein
MSIVTLCNTGCNVAITKLNAQSHVAAKTILFSSKCTYTRLWMIPLCPTPPSTTSINPAIPPPTIIAANIEATSSAGEYACYIDQALCSPPATTLIQALKQNRELATIPGLMAHLINTHLPYSTATNKGHMRHHQQGIQSTGTMQLAIIYAWQEVNSLQPAKEICTAHDCFVLPPLPTSTQAQCTPTSRVHSPSDPSNPCNSTSLLCTFMTSMHPCLCYALQEQCCLDYQLPQYSCHPRSPRIQVHPQCHRQQLFNNSRSAHQIQQNGHSPCPFPQPPCQCCQDTNYFNR